MDCEQEGRRANGAVRILATRLRYLGDVILTTPAVAALKARYPRAEIWYLVEEPYAAVLEGNPDLAGIIALRRGPGGTLAALRRLRRLRFAAAVDWFYNPRSAWLLFLAGIPVRIGGSRRWRRRLYTHVARPAEGSRSAVAHHVAALRDLDASAPETLPRVHIATNEVNEGRGIVERALGRSTDGGPVIAFHPGGTWPAKRWPPERFGALARLARERLGASVVALTGPGEEEIAAAAEGSSGGALAALTPVPVRTAASIIAACDALVANDGGIMHLGVALEKPTVAVFGPTEVDIWFPYEGRGPFAVATRTPPCAPCHKHYCESHACLAELGTEAVLARLEEVLAWRE